LNQTEEKKYTSIGGQAVIEGVMMRSPNSFVVAVRKKDGTIKIRKDQWFGLSQKMPFFKKPFFRGILMLLEAMSNGIVALNYSANEAMRDDLKEQAQKKKMSEEELEKKLKKSEKIDVMTFLTIVASFLLGIGLFIFLPHFLTWLFSVLFNQKWNLDGVAFHAVDGVIKACIFVLYVWVIGFLPDIKRVFQYHGAEHKAIATFEAKEELTIENARKYVTLHPRCGTSFIFFLLFISIIIFSFLFTIIPLGVPKGGVELTKLAQIIAHIKAVAWKILFMFPIAGTSYELIRLSGKYSQNPFCRAFISPGMMLQKLTTKEPDDQQLEVALASIKVALLLEDSYKLKEAAGKVLKLEEIEVSSLSEIDSSNLSLKDFLE